MQFLRDVHPTLLSTLEGIVDQWSTVCFQENWSEEILRLLMETLEKCYVVAFQTRLDVSGAKVTSEIEAELGKLVNLFGKGLGQSSMTGGQGLGLGKRPAGTSSSQDPTLQRLKMQFMSDFDLSGSTPVKLHSLISRLKKWIRIFEMKTKSLPRFTLLEDRCRFLSNFSVSTAEVDIPGEYLQPKQLPYMVHIARFMPHVEIVRRHNIAIRRLFIRGDNGKIYPYMVVNSSSPVTCRREERVLQLLRMMNLYLAKKRETSRRHLMFSAPSVVAVSPNMRLVEDNTSNASLTEIFQQFYLERGIESDPHLTVYYEKLAQIQSHDSQLNPVVLQQVFSEIQNNWIPTSVVKNWALKTYPNATNYWTFRKQVTNQLSLSGLVEFVLHLTRLDPDMLLIARDTGSFTHNYFNFDIDSSGQLDANRPVPFRLSSGLQGLIGTLGKQGPLMLNMVAIARCLVEPKFDFPGLLKAILRDEYIIWCKQRAESETGTVVSLAEIPNEEVTALVEKAVVAILTRLHNLASFEGAESKVSLLITAAEASENLSRMDPVWNPWL
jgi:transformation/transcription domain-associated protein